MLHTPHSLGISTGSTLNLSHGNEQRCVVWPVAPLGNLPAGKDFPTDALLPCLSCASGDCGLEEATCSLKTTRARCPLTTLLVCSDSNPSTSSYAEGGGTRGNGWSWESMPFLSCGAGKTQGLQVHSSLPAAMSSCSDTGYVWAVLEPVHLA